MNPDTEIAIYGNVKIIRTRCPKCHKMSWVQDGIISCCGLEYTGPDVPVVQHIMVNPRNVRVRFKLKDKLLTMEEQDYKCKICGCSIRELQWDNKHKRLTRERVHFDHIIPFKYCMNNSPTNIMALCPICNLIKSDKLFDCLEDAVNFVLQKRAKYKRV